MHEQLIVDGNNLWHAMQVHAPLPSVGRETMVKLIDRWASQAGAEVMVVFDGPTPREGLARQMATRRVNVRFSAPQSADDVIERILKTVRDPAGVRVISSDSAVRSDASLRRCRHTDSVRFVAELCPSTSAPSTRVERRKTAPPAAATPEKPVSESSDQTDEWVRWMHAEDLEIPDEGDLFLRDR